MDELTPEQRLAEKLRNRRHQLEDYQQTLSGAHEFLTAGLVAAQTRQQVTPEAPREPAKPLVTIEQTVLPIIRTQTQDGASAPVPSPPPAPEFDTVEARVCLSDGTVAVVNLMVRS